jgi:hypothetical protein
VTYHDIVLYWWCARKMCAAIKVEERMSMLK